MPAHARRSALRTIAGLALCAVIALAARAEPIPVRYAELAVDEGDVLLSAQFDLALTPPLEEALEKGIPLYFTIDFELTRPRWFWVDEKVLQWSITYRVSYNALTRQYRVASGPLAGASFDTLADVQRFVGRVSSRPIARVDNLVRGARYEAMLRMKLDVNQLPKPFQLNALASREWQLDSEPYRWTFTP
ncbi:MAG TPA: DUF4390 domain-containing protein [Casimicrobiaceae bacterium]